MLSSLGNDGEDGKKFEASLHQVSDICPTPKVCDMAVELAKVRDKDPTAEFHVCKYYVIGWTVIS